MKPTLISFLVALAFAAVAHGASRLTNVSVRSTAGTGADTLIVGFTVSGTGTKPVLIRGVGPSLAAFGVTDAVADPMLRVTTAGNPAVVENDNWNGAPAIAAAAASVGAFALPASSGDAAILTTVAPGSYSAHLEARNATGTALVEVYDMDPAAIHTEISNISARSIAGTGANVLTVGFSITGDSVATVLVRAVGPSLADFGVTGALANPELRLFSANRLMLQNDNWLPGAGWESAFSAVGAFGLANDTRDSALLVALPPGTYTAQASGANSTTGVALIEVYAVTNPPPASFVFEPGHGGNTSKDYTTPAVITQTRPIYPFELLRAGISGEVIVDFVVDVNGRVINAFVLRSTNPGFNESALTAVRQWTFRPGLNATGQPVPTHMQVPITYQIN